jgi:hypothetical protein
LQGNKFEDASAAVWADIIANNLRIEYLDLSHNHFGEDSGKLLGAALAENSSLQELNLGWNNIRRRGALGIAKVRARRYAQRTSGVVLLFCCCVVY